MRIFQSSGRKYPGIFLILSLIFLCAVLFSHIFYLKVKLSKWYDRNIDINQSGLRTFYYPNRDFQEDYTETEVVQEISYSSTTNDKFKKDGFSIRAMGIFCPPKSGRYKFFLRSDDGSRLYIDQDLIIDNGGIHPSEEKAKTIFLKKGCHLIVIEYFQEFNNAELDFGWLKTVETKRGYDLSLFFHPVYSSFQWSKDITRFQKIIKFPKTIYILTLFSIVLIWFILRFSKRIKTYRLKVFVIIVAFPLLVELSIINIKSQYEILDEHYVASAKWKKIRGAIKEHFSNLNPPIIMYLEDGGGDFRGCFSNGIWSYSMGLGVDMDYPFEKIKYVTDKADIIELLKNGWQLRDGKVIKPFLENVYGLRLNRNGFMDITKEIREEIAKSIKLS